MALHITLEALLDSYNQVVEVLGSYLIERTIRKEGVLQVLEARHVLTGTRAHIYRPLSGIAPQIAITGALPFTETISDAWVIELPLGSISAVALRGRVDLERISSWARTLCAVLLEAEAGEWTLSRLDPEHLWVRGQHIWIEGLGLPSDNTALPGTNLSETLRILAGDAWPAWSYRTALEAFEAGDINLRELSNSLSDPRSLSEIPSLPTHQAVQEAKVETKSSSYIRVHKGSTSDKTGSPPANVELFSRAADKPAEDHHSQPEPRPAKPGLSDDPHEGASSPPSVGPNRPKIIRIEESQNPTFEVLEPPPKSRYSRLSWGLAALLVILLGVGAYAWFGRPAATVPTQGYVVNFSLVPSGNQATVVLLSAPKDSKLRANSVLATVPGGVYFDLPGDYTLKVESPSYQSEDVTIHVPSPGITIRLR